MKTNDIKKNDRIIMRNGNKGYIMDNRKGNIRLATIQGLFTEMGSVYAHDIEYVFRDDMWQRVEHTKAQLKLRDTVSKLFA